MTGTRKALTALMLVASLMLVNCAKRPSELAAQKLEAYELQEIVKVMNYRVDKIDPNHSREDYYFLYKEAHNAYIDSELELDECQLDRKNLAREVEDFYYQDY
jgi:hypothetical protein